MTENIYTQAELDLAVAKARLEEAEWWEDIVGIRHTLDQREDCEPDCQYCERIQKNKVELTRLASGRK